MVFVNSKLSDLNKYIGKKLSSQEIKDTLYELGMDVKGETEGKDPELKIEITAEKMDMISKVGIARAIKYYNGFEKKIPQYKLGRSKEKLVVKKSASKTRPKTVAAIIRNAPMSQDFLDEIIELQEKIHDSFGRNRKKAAIGIYPIDKISFPITYGGEKPEDIIFRPLESSRELNGLEILKEHDTGKKFKYLLDGYSLYPVFRDNGGNVLSMPPVINSHDTGRVEVKHKDLFIECSGYNISHLDAILKVLVTTLVDMGAKAESMKVEYEGAETYELNLENHIFDVSLDYARKLIGVDFKESEIKSLLTKMLYGVKEIKGNTIKVEVPCFKSDVWNDSDIADDLARGFGYNNIVPTYPNLDNISEVFDDSNKTFTDSMTSLGFVEMYTYMLSSSKEQRTMMLRDEKLPKTSLINSAEEGINMVRDMILPEVLKSLVINRKNKYPQKVFENGFAVVPDKSTDVLARDEEHLCVAIADTSSNYTSIKEILDSLSVLHGIKFDVKEKEFPFLISGRSGVVKVGSKEVGFIGELHPQVLENFGLIVPVVVFEINLSDLS